MTRTNALIDNDLAQFTLNNEAVVASEVTPAVSTYYYTGSQNAVSDGAGGFVLSNGSTIKRLGEGDGIVWNIDNGDFVEGLEYDNGTVLALDSAGGLTRYDVGDGSVVWRNTQASNGPNSESRVIGVLPSGNIITSSGLNINRFSETGDLLDENYVDTQDYFTQNTTGMDVYNHENSVIMGGSQAIDSYDERAYVLRIDATNGSILDAQDFGNNNNNQANRVTTYIVSDDIAKMDFRVISREGRIFFEKGDGSDYTGSINDFSEIVNAPGSEFVFSGGDSTKKYNLATGSVTSIGPDGSTYAVSERESAEDLYIAEVGGFLSTHTLSEKYFRLGISDGTNLSVNGKTISSMRGLIVNGGAKISGIGVISLMRIK